jgi:Skp family chaperone for outer membrane proteins
LVSQIGAGHGRLALKNARSADVRTISSSVALTTALTLLIGFATTSFGQAPGGASQFGAQPQPTGGAPFNPAAAAGQMQQHTAAAAPGGLGINGMAVIDVAYIFKNHARFKQQMDGMKQKVDAAENEVKAVQEEMKKSIEQMKQFNAGSPEYKRMEADLLKKQGELQLKVNLQKKDFMEQEGKIYFNVSREIEDAVKLFATKNNIAMVLRFNGDQVDPSNRDDILRNINKPIVYYDTRMDITPYILQDLNRSGGVSINPNGSMAPPRR